MQPTRPRKFLPLICFATIALVCSPAQAHPGHGAALGFTAGFAHPFSGIDHLLAMIATGLWASQNRRPAQWILPILFPLAMAAGAAAGMTQGGFAGMDAYIAATVAVLGLFIAFAAKPPLPVSIAVIAVFAALHGYAHGMEMQRGVLPIAYAVGFMAATAVLHLAGIGMGMAGKGKLAAGAKRLAGAAIALAGVALAITA